MYFLRKTFDLGVCLLGYWIGRGYGGWGGGVLVAFAALCATSFGWEWLVRNVIAQGGKGSATVNFVYGVISSILVAVAAYVLWGK